jgi:hypothetical protein
MIMIVGVGLGVYVIAWLMAYEGVDCGLWSHAHRVCMESELCGGAAKAMGVRKYLGDGHATTNHNQ